MSHKNTTTGTVSNNKKFDNSKKSGDIKKFFEPYKMPSQPGPDAPGKEGNQGSSGDFASLRELKYYVYWDRIQERVDQYWRPVIRAKIRDMVIPSEVMTACLITLDKNGNLVSLYVTKSSGWEEIDAIAVNALRQSSPIPNPPKGIEDTDGLIKIKWEFYVTKSSNIRINRGRHR